MNVADTKKEIEEMVYWETRVWDTQDIELLMSIWHPDMVWSYLRMPQSHDPMEELI